MLGKHLYQYIWRHRICGAPHVSFDQVVISMSLIRESGKKDTEKPWRSRYIGFSSGVNDVQKALNNVYTGDLPKGVDPAKRPKIKALAKHFRFKNCEIQEAQWVLEQYGIPKQIAMHNLAEHVRLTEEKKEMERLLEERRQQFPSVEEDFQSRAKIHADGVLEDMECKLSRAVRQHTGINLDTVDPDAEQAAGLHLNLQFKLDEEHIMAVFNQNDFYGIGAIDVKFMSQALGVEAGLGYDVPRDILRKLLHKYDEDDDRCYNFKEFCQMVSDPMLQGRYVGNQVIDGQQGKVELKEAAAEDTWEVCSKVHQRFTKRIGSGLDNIKMFQASLKEKLTDNGGLQTQPLLGKLDSSADSQSGDMTRRGQLIRSVVARARKL